MPAQWLSLSLPIYQLTDETMLSQYIGCLAELVCLPTPVPCCKPLEQNSVCLLGLHLGESKDAFSTDFHIHVNDEDVQGRLQKIHVMEFILR